MKRLPLILTGIGVLGAILLAAETYGNHAPAPDRVAMIHEACAAEYPYRPDLAQSCEIEISLEFLAEADAARMDRAREAIR